MSGNPRAKKRLEKEGQNREGQSVDGQIDGWRGLRGQSVLLLMFKFVEVENKNYFIFPLT
jgi:hypothetical protein